MHILVFIVISFCGILCNSRLIERNTYKTTSKNPEYTTRTRLVRALSEEETVTGFSKEYDSNEAIESLSRQTSSFPMKQVKQVVRVPRESTDAPKTRVALVKKPIPKFNELDYDEDFQMKVIRSAMKYADSAEHEDEDFNLNDYEFDVNHDEFSSRGKPLEPREKNKSSKEQNVEVNTDSPTETTLPPVIKIQSAVVVSPKRSLIKRNNVQVPMKAADKMKLDYYDENATTKAPQEFNKDIDDANEDNEDSKEYARKSLRSVRSPWMRDLFTDKLGEKTVGLFGRIMSMLPMFPQVPRRHR